MYSITRISIDTHTSRIYVLHVLVLCISLFSPITPPTQPIIHNITYNIGPRDLAPQVIRRGDSEGHLGLRNKGEREVEGGGVFWCSRLAEAPAAYGAHVVDARPILFYLFFYFLNTVASVGLRAGVFPRQIQSNPIQSERSGGIDETRTRRRDDVLRRLRA